MQGSLKNIMLLLCVLCGLPILAQEDEPLLRTDTVHLPVKKVEVVGLPVLFYTPETSVGFGGGAQIFLKEQVSIFNLRESNVMTTVIYTANKQLIVNVNPQLYFFDGVMYFDGTFTYKEFPNSFWGVGIEAPESDKEAYNQKSVEFRAALMNRIPPNLNFGFEYRFEKYRMLEQEEGGLLEKDTITGSGGGAISGLYFVFNLDNRDNVYSPLKGNYLQFKGGFSSRVLGGSFSYNKYTIDLRRYNQLNSKSTLASQIYFEGNYGEVPFQNKAWLGGPERGRGYFKGRYIDDHILNVQLEYRWRLAKRFILAGFGSMAEVASNPMELFYKPKYSFGGGLRFQLSKKNPSLIRFDVGFGEAGSSGLYFGVNEAF